ncbi:molybdopterin synthase sulfur carrier subunit [Streptomyces cinnamoneus]|uniref:Molybdopterin synthase sulfur carrier subunit n=1 Tax=Streptomyces cinnamoneus TaxID=53446 RepID=A0A2G1XK22_STRCJ|nr:molybdopterin synthase sulfur carrier subunit [Streptomyces cinnamoneus]PPT14386.1 molybdopterin synthase sulfur carrier subunit [Streptomyces cinnamoneus]
METARHRQATEGVAVATTDTARPARPATLPAQPGTPEPPSGTIRYWAAAKAAAGTAEEPYAARTLADALAAARRRHEDEPEYARVLARCSFLVDGGPVGTRDHSTVQLAEGGTVEVLPPFAGG